MNQISKLNIQGEDYAIAGAAVITTCASTPEAPVKVLTVQSGCVIIPGIMVCVHFTKKNTYGSNTPITIYSSDQVHYYSNAAMTVAFQLADEGNYTIVYTGTGSAYYYTTHPAAEIEGIGRVPLCTWRGYYMHSGSWKDNEDLIFMFNGTKLLLTNSSLDDASVSNTTSWSSEKTQSAIASGNVATAKAFTSSYTCAITPAQAVAMVSGNKSWPLKYNKTYLQTVTVTWDDYSSHNFPAGAAGMFFPGYGSNGGTLVLLNYLASRMLYNVWIDSNRWSGWHYIDLPAISYT